MFNPGKHSQLFIKDIISFTHTFLEHLEEFSKGKMLKIQCNEGFGQLLSYSLFRIVDQQKASKLLYLSGYYLMQMMLCVFIAFNINFCFWAI